MELALHWAQQLSQLLQYLHSQSPPVIFRDLKPENVMVTDSNQLKLVDFGLARHFQPGKKRDTQAAGSIGYCAPEQWEDSDQSDERSDIYGLGATLFYVLTGRAPSPTYGPQNIQAHRPDVEPAVEGIVLKCLRPNPAERFSNGQELSLALKACQSKPQARPARKTLDLALLALLLMILPFASLFGSAHESAARPLRFEQILQRTAPIKARLREASEVNIASLEALVKNFPLDGEAQILLANARARKSRRPVLEIPVFGAVTGSEYEGIQMLNGLAFAQTEMNAQGGILDHADLESGKKMIVLEFFDCQSRQDLTLEGYLKVADNPAVAAVLGPWSSQQLIAVSPLVESAGLPTLAPTASDPRTSQLGKNSLTVADSDLGRVRALAQQLIFLGLRRALVIRNEESVVGHSSSTEFEQIFEALGGKVEEIRGYLQETKDYGQALDQLGAVDADCIFLAEYRAGVVMTLTRKLRARGLNQRIASLASLHSEWPPRENAHELNGLMVCSFFYAQAPDPEIQEFVRRYQAFTGSPNPSHREAYSYDALKLLALAIREVGFRRQNLRDYFDSLGRSRPPYRGVSGEFVPSRRKELRRAYLLEVRDGNLSLLTPIGSRSAPDAP
jgi:ABC-type branched-subunit amino acid transport system substrate-binding protein